MKRYGGSADRLVYPTHVAKGRFTSLPIIYGLIVKL